MSSIKDASIKKLKEKENYFIYVDILRVVSCLFILLYHLKVVKGGYLAVCSFFVLSGYLSCVSALKKEKFSLISYYKNRFTKLYIPLLIVVFLTIGIVSLFPNILWLNLKNETTSVLLNYNNFWQLKVNLDYFSKNVDSPFIHLWYISILIQYDLVFPFIFLLFKKLSDRVHSIFAPLFTILLSISFTIIFYMTNLTKGINIVYYNTFTRIFSILLGLFLGFNHYYYKPLVSDKLKIFCFNKIIFYFYLFVLSLLFIVVDANSEYFAISMILTTLLTMRIIDYAVTIKKFKYNFLDKLIKSISNITYEIYLIQYPIIFMFQYINVNIALKCIIIMILIFLISYILYFCFRSKSNHKTIKYILKFIIICFCLYGVFNYNIAEDHTEEMKELEAKLAENEALMKERQAQYELNYKQEEQNLEDQLKNIENDVNQMDNVISNLPIVGIGDSVMLGAVTSLYSTFNNGYFDAKVSRTAWVVNDILLSLSYANRLGNPIVFHLGTNGDCSAECKKKIINTCGDRDIFWITVTNDHNVNVNAKLFDLEKEYKKIHIIDWNSISKGHSEYFGADKIHLTSAGREAYTKAIYDAIYNLYLERYNVKKQELLSEYENKLKTKISFYGNDVLINLFDYIKDEFSDSSFVMNKEFKFKELKDNLLKAKENNTLTNRIILAFDNTSNITKNEYEELYQILSDKKVYIISFSSKLKSLEEHKNIKVIEFYEELANNNDYIMADRVHLSDKANQELASKLKSVIFE